jgi:hypothetical protein
MPRSKLFILKLAAALSCLACLTGLNLAEQSGVPSSSVSLKNALPTGGTEVSVCQIFVATNGDDAKPGTVTQPLASLERARDYVRGFKEGATVPIGVCLRGGTYQLSSTFTLGPEDSGTAAALITYRSYPGEQAVLSGGVQIHPNWIPFRGQIQVADIDLWFNQLFVNGQRATRARTALFYTGNGEYPLGTNSIHLSGNNLFYAPSVPNFMAQFNKWKALGFDAHSIVAYPQFVDYAHDNFTLDPSSPALRPIGGGGIGFLPIDFSGLP